MDAMPLCKGGGHTTLPSVGILIRCRVFEGLPGLQMLQTWAMSYDTQTRGHINDWRTESVPSVVTNSPSSYLIDAFDQLSK